MSNRDGFLEFKVQAPKSFLRDTLLNVWWICGLIIFLICWILISAYLFSVLEEKQCVDYLRSLYFTVINLTTVGFGDITPKSDKGMILAMVNSVIGVIYFGLLVGVISAGLQSGETSASVRAPVDSALSSDQDRAAGKDPREEFLRAQANFLETINSLVVESEGNAKFDRAKGPVSIEVFSGDRQRMFVHIYIDASSSSEHPSDKGAI